MPFDNPKAVWPIPLLQIEETVATQLGPGRVPGNAATSCLSRQVSMYLAKHVGGWSLPKIGRFYNGRHHTTVLHAITKVERLRETDEAFDALIDVLTATLTSETKNFGAGAGVSLAHSELIDAVAVRVIHRLKELIPERWEQADSHAILAQLGAAKLQAPMDSHATDSAEQVGV
jgi:Bacterial dnaA protein helix-turn-helix